jgi:hypothetical protein
MLGLMWYTEFPRFSDLELKKPYHWVQTHKAHIEAGKSYGTEYFKQAQLWLYPMHTSMRGAGLDFTFLTVA